MKVQNVQRPRIDTFSATSSQKRRNLFVFLRFSLIQFCVVHAILFSFYLKKTSVRHCCPWVTVIICVCDVAASLNTDLFPSHATITCFVTVFSLQTRGEYILCGSVLGKVQDNILHFY